jgi:5-methylthioadenosine/S-adenosylhomocysteine deaminase
MSAPNPQLLLPSWLATAAENLPDAGLLPEGAVLVEGGTIAAIGPAKDLIGRFPNAERVDLSGHLLMPGLINLHTHAAMSLMRGIADDLPLERWLQERIWPIEGHIVSPDFVFDGTVVAAHEMLLGGVTLFNDMYFFPQASARAVLAMGMRAVVGLPVIELSTPYATGAADCLRKGLECRDMFRGEEALQFALAPHAPYTVSDASFREVVGLSAELGMSISCHIHETAQEVNDSIAQYGMRPLARLEQLGVLNPDLVAVHAVHCDARDIDRLVKYDVNVAHCPHSNLKLGSGIAPIAAMLAAGVRVGIGTDGSASNNRLDLLEELRSGVLLAKGSSQNAAVWPAHQALRSVTIDAAQALGVNRTTGSLEVGKSADMISINFSGASTQPVYDPVSHFVYCSGRDLVADVWIRGQYVVRKRQVVSEAARRTVEEVTVRQALWHNSIGELVKAGQ